MKIKVQLPDYQAYHIVTDLKEWYNPVTRKRLKIAVATWHREGMTSAHECRDTVTNMLLHDAIIIRKPGPYQINKPEWYGDKENQRQACRRITDAIVEDLEVTA